MKQYIIVKFDGTVSLEQDLSKIFKDPSFDETQDKIFEVGSEVKLKLSAVPTHSIRSHG
jgi:2-hydroxy-3-keto-5-methylthiopentenyl-1-phosphate phosphatase